MRKVNASAGSRKIRFWKLGPAAETEYSDRISHTTLVYVAGSCAAAQHVAFPISHTPLSPCSSVIFFTFPRTLSMDDSPLRILSLDGGGVRGISSLYILKEIMAQVSRQRAFNRPNEPRSSLRPCDLFDMICGTSTGGLIALMLGRLEMVHLLLIRSLTRRRSMRPLTATKLSLRGYSHPSRNTHGPSSITKLLNKFSSESYKAKAWIRTFFLRIRTRNLARHSLSQPAPALLERLS
jgi:Patatin-like phospholipase